MYCILSDDEPTEDFDVIDHYMMLVKERGLSFVHYLPYLPYFLIFCLYKLYDLHF